MVPTSTDQFQLLSPRVVDLYGEEITTAAAAYVRLGLGPGVLFTFVAVVGVAVYSSRALFFQKVRIFYLEAKRFGRYFGLLVDLCVCVCVLLSSERLDVKTLVLVQVNGRQYCECTRCSFLLFFSYLYAIRSSSWPLNCTNAAAAATTTTTMTICAHCVSSGLAIGAMRIRAPSNNGSPLLGHCLMLTCAAHNVSHHKMRQAVASLCCLFQTNQPGV